MKQGALFDQPEPRPSPAAPSAPGPGIDRPPPAAGQAAEPTASAAADCRRKAAEQIAPVAGAQRRAVLEFIVQRGPRGATDEEIAEGLELQPDSARARRCELRDGRRVVDSGATRPTRSGRPAAVWQAAAIAAAVAPPSAPEPDYTTSFPTGEAGPQRTATSSPAGPAPGRRSRPLGAESGAGPAAVPGGQAQEPTACPRCGCTETIDVRIHNGRSIRRDCRLCARFVRFVVWQGKRLE